MPSNLSVYLTSSKHIVASNKPELIKILRDIDMPVCVASVGLGFSNYGKSQELEEHRVATTCMEDGMKVVDINSKERTIFIGSDPKVKETGIVVYKDTNFSELSNSFFDRWEKLKLLSMEFQVYNITNNLSVKSIAFTIKGLWDTDKWQRLVIGGTQHIHVVDK